MLLITCLVKWGLELGLLDYGKLYAVIVSTPLTPHLLETGFLLFISPCYGTKIYKHDLAVVKLVYHLSYNQYAQTF